MRTCSGRRLAKYIALAPLLAGTLFQSGCDIAAAILDTVLAAFEIVDIWV